MRRGAVLLAMALLASDFALAAEPRHSAPADMVRERTGASVRWVPGAREIRGSSDPVSALLGDTLSAERAVQLAFLNNRALQAAFEEIGISRAEYRQALRPRNPEISAEWRSGPNARHPKELGVMQDISSIVLLPLRRSLTGSAVKQAELQAANAAIELAAEVRAAFYGFQAAEQIGALWERTVAAEQAGADLALRQHEVGNITDLDLENQQALYEQAKVALARAEVESMAARERLNRSIGVWREQTTWVAHSDLPDLPTEDGNLDGLEAQAVSRRLDLQAMEAEVKTRSRSISLARYSQIFEVRAGVHIEREPEGTQTAGPAVEIVLPLFDQGQAATALARAQLRQAESRHAAMAVEVRSQVRSARERLIAARQMAAYYRDVMLPRRQRILDQTQLHFNGMLVGLYQLLQAKEGQIGAQRAYIEAKRDYWVARAELERAMGGALPDPRTGTR